MVELVDAEETHCEVHGLNVPGNMDDNIGLKAFRMLQKDFNLPPQQIVILKNIPVGAGLGGGSSDAAFLIKLLNDKFSLGLSTPKMQDYARCLGADCAFFIENKPVFAKGLGDEFETIDVSLSSFYLVLVKPPVHVSSADAYAKVQVKPAGQSLKVLLQRPLHAWKEAILNDFEPSVFAKYPQINEIKKQLYQAGAIFALMSGSGSSVFGIFEAPVKLPELEIENQVFYDV
ncbi:4-diphosphocytidyl-2-C-methyl-D-erythritol kinase [compost metagenome]